MKNRAFDYDLERYPNWIDPKEVTPYPRNAKLHPPEQVATIVNSITRFGWQQDTVLTADNVLVVGHGRRLAALEIGCKMPFHRVGKNADELTDAEIDALRLADNKVAESGWDFAELDAQLAELELDFDMSDFGFDDILGGVSTDTSTVEDDDYDPDEPIEAKAKIGDIYQLGRHRLMCGDSTDAEDVAKLMDGEKADMVFTDPPYNIASDSKNFAADCSRAMDELSKSEWDKSFDISKLFPVLFECLAENVSVYICTSHFLASYIWAWMKEWADHYSYCIWAKPNPMPSLSKRHWTWNTELICYATRGKHVFNFPEKGHALSTWTINKTNGETKHPTEKPIAVPGMAISHSSNNGNIVLDLFGGSGSTMIACEQLNRYCLMMELDPHYVDVIIARWENLTGEKAVLLNG